MYWWLWNDFVQACHPITMSGEQSEADKSPSDVLDIVSRYGETAFCWWNNEQGCHAFSDNWTNISGLSQHACAGHRLWEHINTTYQAELQNIMETLFSSDISDPQPVQQIECLIHISDEISQWVELRLIAVPSADIPTLAIIMRDIQKEKGLQAHAHVAQRMSEVAAQRRSSFLSNMSHELRTPLNAILGFAQMLEMNTLTKGGNPGEYLQHIRESGQLLLGKINDLIELSNIDAHCAKMYNTPLNISELIENAVEMHSHTAFAAGITLSHTHTHHSLVVQADRVKLLHILSHLIENAIRHSNKGDKISVRCTSNMTSGVVITVQDHGAGLSYDHLCRIQDAMQSTHAYYATDIDSIGIGLSVAKEFAELHDGTLSIDSEKDEGTTVTLTLPPERIVSLSARAKLKPRVGLPQPA